MYLLGILHYCDQVMNEHRTFPLPALAQCYLRPGGTHSYLLHVYMDEDRIAFYSFYILSVSTHLRMWFENVWNRNTCFMLGTMIMPMRRGSYACHLYGESTRRFRHMSCMVFFISFYITNMPGSTKWKWLDVAMFMKYKATFWMLFVVYKQYPILKAFKNSSASWNSCKTFHEILWSWLRCIIQPTLLKSPQFYMKQCRKKSSYPSYKNKSNFIPTTDPASTPILFDFEGLWHMLERKHIRSFQKMPFSFPFLVRNFVFHYQGWVRQPSCIYPEGQGVLALLHPAW